MISPRAVVMLVSGFFEPLFYLLSIGIGLNKLVGNLHVHGQVIIYVAFVALRNARDLGDERRHVDSIFNTFFRLKISHSYDAILATPLEVTDIALGEVLWPLARHGVLASFIVCMAGSRYEQSVGHLLLARRHLDEPDVQLYGSRRCTFMRTWQDFDLVTLVQLPLFCLGTFFRLLRTLTGSAPFVWFSPLYQSAALLRGLSLGHSLDHDFRAGYLLSSH